MHAMPSTRIVIIGGGFAGLGMAIRLRQRGIAEFVILERAADHGGTWRDNSYPGCACDVQSALYSYSFAPNPDWSHTYAPQAEIWAYLRRCATAFDIDRHFVFGQDVTGAEWDDVTQEWTVHTATDAWIAEAVVLASGGLSDPVEPDLPGLADFRGERFHSARWNHDLDLSGKRVAVIGTGASAIQFVPQIQPRVAELTVFQRTPPWVMPRHDTAIPGWRKSLYRSLPLVQRLVRGAVYAQREALLFPFRHEAAARPVEWVARRHMESQVHDPALRRKLRPTYRIGCKRILVSDDYYPALTQPNVQLVTDAITTVTADGITTADGTHRPADVIIFGTGFRPTDPPLAPFIHGHNGESLADAWQGSPMAYMGTTIPGFPNFFVLMGPNTALGHSSVVLMIEAQIAHVLGVLSLLEKRAMVAAEPQAKALKRYVAAIDERLATTTWNTGGCASWYLDRTGRNSALWPDGVGRFRRLVSHVHASDYKLIARRERTAEFHT
jgi:cation diffusion facilitator CzcD-associated flavoprotein CzcO